MIGDEVQDVVGCRAGVQELGEYRTSDVPVGLQVVTGQHRDRGAVGGANCQSPGDQSDRAAGMSRVRDVGAHVVEIEVQGAGARGAAVADFADGQGQDAVRPCGNRRDECFWFVRQHAKAAMDVDDAGASARVGEFEDRVAPVLGTHGRDDVARAVGESVDAPVTGVGGQGVRGVDGRMGAVEVAQTEMDDACGLAGRCAKKRTDRSGLA